MIKRVSSPVENNLLLLYSIYKLESITNLQLWQFVSECELMDYFTYRLALNELLANSHLQTDAHPFGKLYSLTREGKNMLSFFEKKIPFSIKTVIDKKTIELKRHFHKEQEFLSSFYKDEDGAYTLNLTLLEKGEELFNVCLGGLERQDCIYYSNVWPSRSVDIYSKFMEIFGENFSIESDLNLTPKPNDYGSIQISNLNRGATFKGRWSAKHLPKDNRLFSVKVFLPTRAMAQYFSMFWEEKKESFFLYLQDALSK